ncbi:helix-turn-helix domain-containing protein [Massiliimalia timonensis]|uniref:helix-turn-helix domain-containing protein n=1 Tax=Massiliimalia timonensis TaxID=1987501 RepID=UPI0018A04187|nr:helix-turn-helix domain-containing protein [Massiliimalia timonensis]
MAFYNKLIELCEKNHVKPSVVAEAVGLTKSSATYWKRGAEPKSATIKKIAEYFEVPVSYFIPVDNSIKQEEYALFLKQMKYSAICALLDQLNEVGVDMVRKYAEYLTEDKKYQSGIYNIDSENNDPDKE